MLENLGKKCVIWYKKAWINSRLCMGERFDSLWSCCRTFKEKFSRTGNEKSPDWNKPGPYNAKGEGLNFVVHHGELKLLLCGDAISHCPWCGAPIEIVHAKNVTLGKKTKKVPDGYEESEVRNLIPAGVISEAS